MHHLMPSTHQYLILSFDKESFMKYKTETNIDFHLFYAYFSMYFPRNGEKVYCLQIGYFRALN